MSDISQILDSQVDGLVHRYSVALDFEKVEQLTTERLRHLKKTVQIKGFRRGKAPLNIVRRHHGKKIVNAIIDRLSIVAARTVISENALQPVGRPTIEIDSARGTDVDDIRFTLTLETFPDVVLNPIDTLKIERLIVSSSDSSDGRTSNRHEPVNPKGADADLRLRELSRQHVKRQIFDLLMEEYEFAVPVEMVRREHQRITRTYRETVEDGIPSDLEAEFCSIAERRIRLAILLTEIGRQHHIRIPKEEVQRLVEAQADRDPEHGTELVNYYIEHPTAMAELQSTLFEDQVVDFILERTEITERQVNADELIAACEAG